MGKRKFFFQGPKPEIAAQMRKMLTVAERDNTNAFEVAFKIDNKKKEKIVKD